MKLLLILIGILIFMFFITIIKLYDCGLSFKDSIFISLTILKFIKVNIKLFIEYKDKHFDIALKALLHPLKYKSYLEYIAMLSIELQSKLKVINNIIPTLKTSDERTKLNKWIRSQGLNLKVNKNKDLVLISEDSSSKRNNCIPINKNTPTSDIINIKNKMCPI